MQKKFYVSKNDRSTAPSFSRFSRIQQLNSLLSQGWVIKSFNNDEDGEFFLIEK